MRTLLLLALIATQALAAAPVAPLERLAALYTGTFSTAEQAAADKNYRHVVLHVVRIWPGRSDGPWLYVEQALAEAPDQPYRQQIQQLAVSPDGDLESRVFTLDDPIKATGAWRLPAPLADLAPERLTFREGCTVYLHEMPDGSFVGATRGDGCVSDLRGATHATSTVTLAADRLTLWDRGYNAARRQVWGSANGGHLFKRQAVP